MKASLVLILASAACALPEFVGAQALQDYRCSIERVDSASPPNSKNFEVLRTYYVGREFTVDRRTGVMAGALKNSYVTLPEVIDAGSKDNSFKAVTTLRLEQGVGRGTNVYVLVVNEWERSPKKTFVFLENQDVYLGTCVHF